MSIHPTPHRALEEVLKKVDAFKPRCIQPGEDRDKALFYAGQCDLAQKIKDIIIKVEED